MPLLAHKAHEVGAKLLMPTNLREFHDAPHKLRFWKILISFVDSAYREIGSVDVDLRRRTVRMLGRKELTARY